LIFLNEQQNAVANLPSWGFLLWIVFLHAAVLTHGGINHLCTSRALEIRANTSSNPAQSNWGSEQSLREFNESSQIVGTVVHRRTWQLQDAKVRLSRVIKRARIDGPQDITQHGRSVAMLVSHKTHG
jgi:prevent-host-death family protein